MRRWIAAFTLTALSSISCAVASDSDDASAAKFKAILDKDPGSLYAWKHLGIVRLQQGRLDEACRAFKHAMKLNPRDAAVQLDLGLCYFEQHKYFAAIPPFERAEKLNPGNSNVHAFLARCYDKTGRHEDAENEHQTENLQQLDTFR